MTPPQALVIGLDGVPFALLEALYASNSMPYLASLQADSYAADLISTVPPMSPTAWTTLATGANPGQHGILHFVDLRPGKARPSDSAQWLFPDLASLLNADKIVGPTIWELLSAAGKRQVIVNVPLTYPPRPVNGIMVTGMLTPPNADVFTYPASLSDKLRAKGYQVELSVDEKDFDLDHEVLVERIEHLLERRTAACLDLMRDEPCDFFMVVFTGTDRAQHHCWKYLVPGCPEYDTEDARRIRPLLEAYFTHLDQSIAALVERAGPDARVMILSDHGFGPIHERTLHTLPLMERLGMADRLSRSPVVRLRRFVEGRLGITPTQIRRWAKALLPGAWAAKLDARVREAQLDAGSQGIAYVVPMHSYIGGIYINRDLVPEPEVGGAKDAYRSALKGLIDPANGASLVERVMDRDELYSGASIDDCPDLVFFLAQGYGLADGAGPGGALVAPRRRRLNQQGVHRDRGILMLHGPGFEPGHRGPAQLLDVTATLLYLLDVDIPANLESRIIDDAFEEHVLSQRPPRIVATTSEGGGADGALQEPVSREDQEQMLARLRGLGYIE